jgi:hypothetical protein
MVLYLVTFNTHFEQWGLKTIGEINPCSSKGHKYVMESTNYFILWLEAINLTIVNDMMVI